MAPKEPTKGGKRSSKPKEPRESELKKLLLLLWDCHKASGAQIAVPAVAKHFGINHNAARLRVSRLKKKLNKIEASTKSGGQDKGEDSDKNGF
ncbi:uncharacterized protein PGRI_003420 [Penicillium griseofulvum]|uniref:Myb-like DNA-binding domain-containing protein n=1 Tax=Penicillium patulum TaxID=5078 RepID=A0A135LWE4_PENPA|nr:uncharacterized protein PGRI_003420 [Penicillium griseofulvum]KXG53292.1 hypothetical protein PGRI_003420 [Penicillium griseofulvum]